MSEICRLIVGLKAKGMPADEILDLICWMETGEEQYRTKERPNTENEA